MAELFSLPKDKIRVLLLEGVNDSAVELFQNAGYTNLTHLKTALDRERCIRPCRACISSASARARSSPTRSSRPPTA